ncbi:MAG: small multi-drug export protein [Planctomycetota bacterium]
MTPSASPPPETPLPAPVHAPPIVRSWWARTTDRVHRIVMRLVYLLTPIVATGLVLLLVLWLQGWDYVHQAIGAGAASLFGLGTTVVFGKAVLDGAEWLTLGTWDLALIVMWVNAASAFFYTWNLDLLERVPKIGPALHQMREDAQLTVTERPWIRRLSTVGVGMFVISPLPGSGALGGSIVGRLIGLSRRATALAVTWAGVIVCLVYAMLGEKVRKAVEDVPLWIKIGGGVLGLALIWLFLRWLRRAAARTADEVRARQEAGQPAPSAAPSAATGQAKHGVSA